MRNNTPVIVGAIAVVALVVTGLWLVSGNSKGPSGLTGTTWQLSAITEQTPTFQGVVPAAEQANYAIAFNDDGTYTGRADCNAIAGTYTTGRNNSITIEAGASTLIACPGDSYGPLFAHAITTATTYAIANGDLTLSRDDGASMTFVAGSAGKVVGPDGDPHRVAVARRRRPRRRPRQPDALPHAVADAVADPDGVPDPVAHAHGIADRGADRQAHRQAHRDAVAHADRPRQSPRRRRPRTRRPSRRPPTPRRRPRPAETSRARAGS